MSFNSRNLPFVSSLVPFEQALPDHIRRRALQRDQALLDPLGQSARRLVGWRRQNQRDGFGEVSDRLIALFEKPGIDAGAFDRTFTQQPRRNRLARPASRQEIRRPCGVRRRRRPEIAFERNELRAGRRGGVEVEVELASLS
jgi:hypothetical protein